MGVYTQYLEHSPFSDDEWSDFRQAVRKIIFSSPIPLNKIAINNEFIGLESLVISKEGTFASAQTNREPWDFVVLQLFMEAYRVLGSDACAVSNDDGFDSNLANPYDLPHSNGRGLNVDYLKNKVSMPDYVCKQIDIRVLLRYNTKERAWDTGALRVLAINDAFSWEDEESEELGDHIQSYLDADENADISEENFLVKILT